MRVAGLAIKDSAMTDTVSALGLTACTVLSAAEPRSPKVWKWAQSRESVGVSAVCKWQTSERNRRRSTIHRSCNSQAESVEADIGVAIEADSRAYEVAFVAPGAPANDAVTRIAAANLGRCIDWRTAVVLVPAVLDPLPNVAEHVVKPEGIWLE
jgi:hypothetical protein